MTDCPLSVCIVMATIIELPVVGGGGMIRASGILNGIFNGITVLKFCNV